MKRKKSIQKLNVEWVHTQTRNETKWNKNEKSLSANKMCTHCTRYTIENIWNGTQWKGTDDRLFMIWEWNVKTIRVFSTEKCPSIEEENTSKDNERIGKEHWRNFHHSTAANRTIMCRCRYSSFRGFHFLYHRYQTKGYPLKHTHNPFGPIQ